MLEVQGGRVISPLTTLQNQPAPENGLGEGKASEGWVGTGTRAAPHSSPALQSPTPYAASVAPVLPPQAHQLQTALPHLLSASGNSLSSLQPQGLCTPAGFQSPWVPPPYSYLPPPSQAQCSPANAVPLLLQLWVCFLVPESLLSLFESWELLVLLRCSNSLSTSVSVSPTLYLLGSLSEGPTTLRALSRLRRPLPISLSTFPCLF